MSAWRPRAGQPRAGQPRAGSPLAGWALSGWPRVVVALAAIAGLVLLTPDPGSGVLAFVAVALVAVLTVHRLGVRLPAPVPAGLVAGARRADYRGAPRHRDPDARGRTRPRAPGGRPAAARA